MTMNISYLRLVIILPGLVTNSCHTVNPQLDWIVLSYKTLPVVIWTWYQPEMEQLGGETRIMGFKCYVRHALVMKNTVCTQFKRNNKLKNLNLIHQGLRKYWGKIPTLWICLKGRKWFVTCLWKISS